MSYRDFNPPADRQIRLSEAAAAVACPTCEAWPGSPCSSLVSLDERGLRRPHPKRMQSVDEFIRAAASGVPS